MVEQGSWVAPGWLTQLILLLLQLRVCWGQSCSPLFPRDSHTQHASLPMAIQLEPTYSPAWQSRWEVVGLKGDQLACFEMMGDAQTFTVRAAVAACYNVSAWAQVLEVTPALERGGPEWFNLFTFFVSASPDALSLELNQRQDYGLILQGSWPVAPAAVRRLNMSVGGPKTRFPPVEVVEGCLALGECDAGWLYLSLHPADTVYLYPHNSSTTLELHLTLSNCFPKYNLALYDLDPDSPSPVVASVDYQHRTHYHTLTLTLNGRVVLTRTVSHNGADCSEDWRLLGVKGASAVPNCKAVKAATVRLDSAANQAWAYPSPQGLLGLSLLISSYVQYILWL